MIGAAALSGLIDATWPALRRSSVGGWTIREGGGGGSRVSAATAEGPGEIEVAEAEMRALGQVPLFMLRDGEEALDADLAARGYEVRDPTLAMVAPVAALAAEPPDPFVTFAAWPPLAAQREIWAAGGIGPSRLAIMERVAGPRVSILARAGDDPAGTAFAAIHEGCAVIHAVETAEGFRRRGLGRQMMRAIAVWAREQEAARLALLVTRGNAGARALYRGMGFEEAGAYHYRRHPVGG